MGDNTLVIAVMGATGAGKSTFINLASGSNLQIGYGLESCTSDIQISPPFELNGRLVTLIDTPGFDDTVRSEAEILKLIADFLAATYKDGRKLNGIIFIHRISDYRMGGVARKNFRRFGKLCGDDALQNVLIVTNMWNSVTLEVGARREKELSESDLFFKPALERGAQMVRHNDTVDSARNIVCRFMGEEYMPKALSIQKELTDMKKSIAETAAGQDIEDDLKVQKAKHEKEMQEIREELEELAAEQDKQHEEEIETLTQALGDVKSQLDKIEWAHGQLYEERDADRRAAEAKAKSMAKAIQDREMQLKTLRMNTLDQATKISQLQGSLGDSAKPMAMAEKKPVTANGSEGQQHAPQPQRKATGAEEKPKATTPPSTQVGEPQPKSSKGKEVDTPSGKMQSPPTPSPASAPAPAPAPTTKPPASTPASASASAAPAVPAASVAPQTKAPQQMPAKAEVKPANIADPRRKQMPELARVVTALKQSRSQRQPTATPATKATPPPAKREPAATVTPPPEQKPPTTAPAAAPAKQHQRQPTQTAQSSSTTLNQQPTQPQIPRPTAPAQAVPKQQPEAPPIETSPPKPQEAPKEEGSWLSRWCIIM